MRDKLAHAPCIPNSPYFLHVRSSISNPGAAMVCLRDIRILFSRIHGHAMIEPRASTSSGVLSQGLLSMLAYSVNFIASFFAIIAIIRIMGKESYGVMALAMQIVAFTSMLSDFGIGPVIQRRLAIDASRCMTVLKEAVTARLILLLPTYVLTMLIGLALEPSGSFLLVLNIMMLNIVISSKLPVLRGTLETLYRARSKMGFPSMAMAVDSLVLLGAVLSMPMMFTDPVIAMAVYTGSNVLGATMLLWGGLRMARTLSTETSSGVTVRNIRALLLSASPLAVYLVLNALHVSIDTIYLKIFHGDADVGVFNAAMRIMTPLAVLPAVIALSVSPAFARGSIASDDAGRERVSELFSLSVKTVFIASLLLTGLGMANAGLIVGVAFKQQLNDAIQPMIVLFVVFIPMSLNILLIEVNNANDKLRTNTIAAAVLAGMSLILGPLLVMHYGTTGAAINKFIAASAGLIYLASRSRSLFSFRVRSLVWKSAVILACFAGALYVLRDVHPLVSNPTALLASVAGLFVLRVYTTGELLRWKEQLTAMFRRYA